MTQHSSPFPKNRQERLLELLRARGSIVVSEIAPQFEVSELTIRRDINALAHRGLVTRVHGGATLTTRCSPLVKGSNDAHRENTRYTFGMVVPSFSYYWPSIIGGARAAAADAGTRLLLRGSFSDGHDHTREIRILAETHGVDGLIVAPTMEATSSGDLLRWLESLPLPVVLAERQALAPVALGKLEWAVSDHAAGAALAVQHLYAQGHRRIGLFVSEASPTAVHIRRGWHNALHTLGLDPDEQLSGEASQFTETGRDAVLDDVVAECRRRGTTALLVHPDPPAVSLVQHCVDAGVSVPEELAVVAYDDEVAHLGEPPITAVRPPKQYVGRLAVDLLVARLEEGHQRPAHRVTISPQLIIRDSSVTRGRPLSAERATDVVADHG